MLFVFRVIRSICVIRVKFFHFNLTTTNNSHRGVETLGLRHDRILRTTEAHVVRAAFGDIPTAVGGANAVSIAVP